jgi:hypothetical protein
MKLKFIFLLSLILLNGCTTVVVSNDHHRINSDEIKYGKEGKSCSNRILFFRSGYSDFTIDTAKKNGGGIKEIIFLETKTYAFPYIPYGILPALFLRECIAVKGN